MKRLVPLGFTRSDIRKELYLTQGEEGGADAVDGGGEGSPYSSLGGVALEGEGQEKGEEDSDGGKAFAIQCMQVSVYIA